MDTVVIVGGGASGMMAALTAAGDGNRRIVLLERQQRLGRKLLSTGNGRCNLTNIGAAPENYHGEQAGFAASALRAFPPQAALDFFHSLGLVTVTEEGGRVYPLSDSANSVLDVLRFALQERGVEVVTSCPVSEIRRRGDSFLAVTEKGEFKADDLIVACGGAAGAKLGGGMDGYALLAALGHGRTKLYPALAPLLTAPEYPRALKGVRADGSIRLVLDGQTLARGEGDIQFTERGVSGPAAFDLARAASTAGDRAALHLNFMRSLSAEQLSKLLRARREVFPGLETAELFTGMVHNRLGRMLIKYAGLNASASIGTLTDGELERAAHACRDFTLPLRGVEGFDSAQVTAGGVRTQGFDPETLESRSVPRLFACGEVLDVDGDCGGYNLQWAWASGYVAGRLGR